MFINNKAFCKVRSVRSLGMIARLRDLNLLSWFYGRTVDGNPMFMPYSPGTSLVDIQNDIDAGRCYFVATRK